MPSLMQRLHPAEAGVPCGRAAWMGIGPSGRLCLSNTTSRDLLMSASPFVTVIVVVIVIVV